MTYQKERREERGANPPPPLHSTHRQLEGLRAALRGGAAPRGEVEPPSSSSPAASLAASPLGGLRAAFHRGLLPSASLSLPLSLPPSVQIPLGFDIECSRRVVETSRLYIESS